MDNPVNLSDNPFTTQGQKNIQNRTHPMTCNGNDDGATDDSSTGPTRCISASEDVQRYFSFDAVFPAPGLRLTMASALLATDGLSQGATGSRFGVGRNPEVLRGRSVEEEDLPLLESLEINCFCNASFIAEACCHSETGFF
jgi:hypothetical protein